MSKEYCQKFGLESKATTTAEMREYCKRPGVYDADGKPQYYTEQHHKKECDVNNIIKKYDRTGLLSHVNKIEATYGDMTGLDYREMLDKVMDAKNKFNELPSNIRKRFRNKPEELLRFMEDPSNREEAIRIGLIHPETPPEEDGLGEHVKKPELPRSAKKKEEKE